MHPLVHKILTWNVVFGVIGLSTWLTTQVQTRHEQGTTPMVVAYAPQQSPALISARLPSTGASSASTRATVLARR